MSDLVAVWDVPLCDKVHLVEFEHGTTTGKRVLKVDGKVCHRNPFRSIPSHPIPSLLTTCIDAFQSMPSSSLEQEIVRRDWMFKLVGSELFEISGDDEQVHAKCEILINASTGFTYEYSLFVNGKQLKKFKEKQSKIMRTWVVELNQQMWRITLGSYSHFTLLYIRPLFFLMSSSLEKESLDIWVNGLKAETTHEVHRRRNRNAVRDQWRTQGVHQNDKQW